MGEEPDPEETVTLTNGTHKHAWSLAAVGYSYQDPDYPELGQIRMEVLFRTCLGCDHTDYRDVRPNPGHWTPICRDDPDPTP